MTSPHFCVGLLVHQDAKSTIWIVKFSSRDEQKPLCSLETLGQLPGSWAQSTEALQRKAWPACGWWCEAWDEGAEQAGKVFTAVVSMHV